MIRDCLVMAKPGGSRCNLRCDYCYYLGKEAELASARSAPASSGRSQWPMPKALLESYVAQRIDGMTGGSVHFEWHGGEPTLLGLDYFRRVVRAQRRHLGPGRSVTNGIQTNGILLDEDWADFLASEGFSVGLSLDGPPELHDRYRKGPDGSSTHARVMRAHGLLKERGIFCNLLCVLHEGNAAQPEAVYGFFKEIGAKYLQFLPLVPRPDRSGTVVGGAAAAASGPEAIGEFLCAVFDRWLGQDVGRMVVQTFDEALRPIYGAPHALCVHRETCGDVAVLERDGSFFACDHFVDEDHLIGNLVETSLAALSGDPRMEAFGRAKRDELPRACRDCEVLSSCNGGCPKDRFVASREGPAMNYLCPAYKKFFVHSKPGLGRLAEHMKSGKSLRSFKPAFPG